MSQNRGGAGAAKQRDPSTNGGIRIRAKSNVRVRPESNISQEDRRSNYNSNSHQNDNNKYGDAGGIQTSLFDSAANSNNIKIEIPKIDRKLRQKKITLKKQL